MSGVTGEVVGEAYKNLAYGDTPVNQLTEQQKTVIKEIGGLAGGLSAIVSGGISGLDDSEIADNIYAGQRIGKNAVENNLLTRIILGEEVEQKANEFLQNFKDKALTSLADKHVASDDLVEKTLLFGSLIAYQNLPEDMTEAEIYLLTLGFGALAAKPIAKGFNAIDGKVSEFTNWLFRRGGDDVVTTSSKYWTKTVDFEGQRVYQRDDLIDFNLVDGRQRTNLERMQKGIAPIGPDGESINLHHMIQKQDGALAETTAKFHEEYRSIIHINDNTIPSGINRNEFNLQRSRYWKARAEEYLQSNINK